MSRALDIYTADGLKVTLCLRLSGRGEPTLYVHVGVGICVSAVCESVTLVTLPSGAFLDMPGCCVLFNSEFLEGVEALLAEAEVMAENNQRTKSC